MFVYVIVRLILKWNEFYDYISSKKCPTGRSQEMQGVLKFKKRKRIFFADGEPLRSEGARCG